jgi:hypothetical protein
MTIASVAVVFNLILLTLMAVYKIRHHVQRPLVCVCVYAQTLLADFRARGGRIQVTPDGRVIEMSRERDPSPGPKKDKDGLEETLSADPCRSGICWEKKVSRPRLNDDGNEKV